MPTRRDFLHTLAAAPLAPALRRQPGGPTPLPRAAERLIVISLDGVRVQEMFGGLDRDLLQALLPKQKVEDHPLYKTYWQPTAEGRRQALMPFLWGTLLANHGAIVGNQAKGSVMRLGNRHRFSYPGYAELMLGETFDDEIDSNTNRRYPHDTVLQFLRTSLGAKPEQVAMFGSWETFQSIPASRDGEVYTNAGYQAYESSDPGVQALSKAQFETVPSWDSARYDHYTFRFGMAHLARYRPLVQWFAFDESDDWAHQRNYVRVLQYLHQFDTRLQELWTWLQSQDEYRGKTAIAIVTDHGRGLTPEDWNGHGKDVEGAQNVWAAFAVPGWKARGERTDHASVSQSQVAATLAAILGYDWRSVSPKAGAPMSW